MASSVENASLMDQTTSSITLTVKHIQNMVANLDASKYTSIVWPFIYFDFGLFNCKLQQGNNRDGF